MDSSKYAAIQVMFKVREGKNSDSFFELVEEWLGPCGGSDDEPCDCGLESMGSTEGTEEQCWKHLGIHESICEVKTEDLKMLLCLLDSALLPVEIKDAYDRLEKEAFWHDNFYHWMDSLPDEEEE